LKNRAREQAEVTKKVKKFPLAYARGSSDSINKKNPPAFLQEGFFLY
jgi:hypothetical protein